MAERLPIRNGRDTSDKNTIQNEQNSGNSHRFNSRAN